MFITCNKKSTEAVTRRCSVKKVFLEISQNSQENTCASRFFKRDSGTGVFLWILWNFQNTFHRTPPVAASVSTQKYTPFFANITSNNRLITKAYCLSDIWWWWTWWAWRPCSPPTDIPKISSLTCNFIKKEAQVFSCEFCEISKNTFFTEHLLTSVSVISLLLIWKQQRLCG